MRGALARGGRGGAAAGGEHGTGRALGRERGRVVPSRWWCGGVGRSRWGRDLEGQRSRMGRALLGRTLLHRPLPLSQGRHAGGKHGSEPRSIGMSAGIRESSLHSISVPVVPMRRRWLLQLLLWVGWTWVMLLLLLLRMGQLLLWLLMWMRQLLLWWRQLRMGQLLLWWL